MPVANKTDGTNEVTAIFIRPIGFYGAAIEISSVSLFDEACCFKTDRCVLSFESANACRLSSLSSKLIKETLSCCRICIVGLC